MRLLSLTLLGLLAAPTSAALFSGPDLGDYHDGDTYIPTAEVPELPTDNLIKIPDLVCVVNNAAASVSMECFVCLEIGGSGNVPAHPNPEVNRLRASIGVAAGFDLITQQWGPFVVVGAGPRGNAECPSP